MKPEETASWSVTTNPTNKRDIFAAAALQGLLAHSYDGPTMQQNVEWAFKYADLMIEESERGEK